MRGSNAVAKVLTTTRIRMRRTITHRSAVRVQRVEQRADHVRTPAPLRLAAAIVAVEALVLLGAAVFVVVDTIAGHPNGVARALLGAGFALLAAVVLALGARGLLLARPGARSPIVVLELLALPVGYSAAFDADRPVIGVPILLAAVSVLYLIFTPPA